MKAAGKAKLTRSEIEARQHDLAALREAHHQRIDQIGIAAGVIDRVIIATLVFRRVDRAVTDGTGAAGGIGFPHRRRLAAQRQRESRDQPAEHAVADDEIG